MSAVRSYLKAAEATNSDDPKVVIAKMRETPVNDAFTPNGHLRPDGRMVHDVYLVQIKSPAESQGDWDLAIRSLCRSSSFSYISALGRTRASIAVHSFPASTAIVEPHVVKNGEAIAIRPMTIEEAVKDAEFRDRDLLIFRNASGDVFVLHRRRDGQMELVEIP